MDKDYIIAFDENGQPYIAHIFSERARRAAAEARSKAHKYIAKWGEGAKARYFYTKEELDAAMGRGREKVSEASRRVKRTTIGTVRKVGTTVQRGASSVLDKTGITARDRRDTAVARARQASVDAQRANETREKAGYTVDSSLAAAKANTEAALAKIAADKAIEEYSKTPLSKIEAAIKTAKDSSASWFKQAQDTVKECAETSLSVIKDAASTASDTASDIAGSVADKLKKYVNVEGAPSVLSYLKGDKNYRKIIEKAILKGVSVKAVEKHEQNLSESEIIERISGGDLTKGSCSSLALTYIANKMGYDVLDFRGGSSTDLFSSYDTMLSVVDMIGKTSPGSAHQSRQVKAMDSARQTLEWVDEGKEYYFAAGCHAAMVKKENGQLYYLELQSPVSENNGWQELNEEALTWRFACYYTNSTRGMLSVLIDSEAFSNKDIVSLFSYINTDEKEQRKGGGGSVK